MRRRDFLKTFSLLSTSAWAPTFLAKGVRAAQTQGDLPISSESDGPILVIVELAGGCDGLNTVIPYTNDSYYMRRPNLAIQPKDALVLDSSFGLHPSMRGIYELYQEGKVSVVHGVGYPNPNRSHFRSRDIWHTASPDGIKHDGWIAKYVSTAAIGDTFEGVNIGGKVPRAMISAEGSSPSIQSIDTYKLQSDPKYPADAQNRNAAFQEVLKQPSDEFPLQDYVTQTILDATVSSVQLLEGKNKYSSTVEYPSTVFAQNLKTIAQILAADLGVSVFYTSLGGFDTHASQVSSGNSAAGRHAVLLDTFSSGIKAFLDDIRGMGKERETLVMTFSEFGRRLSENGSLGTDHGTANQVFLVGSSVVPGLHGTHPGLGATELDRIGDMMHTNDFRSVYATLLANWLGADPISVLGEDFPILGFI